LEEELVLDPVSRIFGVGLAGGLQPEALLSAELGRMAMALIIEGGFALLSEATFQIVSSSSSNRKGRSGQSLLQG
jgi:hypothetical protein